MDDPLPLKLALVPRLPQNFDRSMGGRASTEGALEPAGDRWKAGAPVPRRPLARPSRRTTRTGGRGALSTICAARSLGKCPPDELYLVLAPDARAAGRRARPCSRTTRAANDAQRRRMDHASAWWPIGSFCEQPPRAHQHAWRGPGATSWTTISTWARWNRRSAMSRPGDRSTRWSRRSSKHLSPRGDASTASHKGETRPQRRGARPRAWSSARRPSAIPALLDQPTAADALDAAGIPWTAFKYAKRGQFQVIREQAGTFADSIKLWSGVSHETAARRPQGQSMERQKSMMADHFERLARAERPAKVGLHLRAREPHRAASCRSASSRSTRRSTRSSRACAGSRGTTSARPKGSGTPRTSAPTSSATSA